MQFLLLNLSSVFCNFSACFCCFYARKQFHILVGKFFNTKNKIFKIQFNENKSWGNSPCEREMLEGICSFLLYYYRISKLCYAIRHYPKCNSHAILNIFKLNTLNFEHKMIIL